MNKIISVVFIFHLFLSIIQAQDLPRLISTEICHCIDTIENMDSLEAKLDRCFPQSVENVFELLDEETQELYSDDAAIEKVIDQVYQKLLSYCPKIRKFILSDKEREFYRMSDSRKAKDFFLAGNKALDSGDYKTAAKQFLKAIKADPGWVYPYDYIGLTYRNMGKYEKAIKYYNKSLEIYPEGAFALQNQAVAYTFLNDFKKAQTNYDYMIYLYPDNPVGYFGIAQVSFMKGDYEKAIDYAIFSYKIYLSQNSECIKDSEKLLSEIYEKLKEQGKESHFFEKAKEFGINIIQN